MDELDERIYAALRANARISVADLARQCDLARTTVQARIERLEREGVIGGYTVVPGPARARGRIAATVLLQLAPRAAPALLSRLRTMPQVVGAHTASGRFDMVLQVEARDTAELDRLLDEIGEIEGVRSSESLIRLSVKIDRNAGAGRAWPTTTTRRNQQTTP